MRRDEIDKRAAHFYENDPHPGHFDDDFGPNTLGGHFEQIMTQGLFGWLAHRSPITLLVLAHVFALVLGIAVIIGLTQLPKLLTFV